MQATSQYEISGFNKIDPNKDFLQPIHSGGSHWSLLSNIGLSQAEKSSGNKILYFDSLIHLNSKDTQAMIPPAATWQAAQLLKKEDPLNARPIDIVVIPVHQQSNTTDCGLHVLATMMTLATGLNPSEIVYKPGMRTQLLNMFKSQKALMFDYELRNDNGPNRSKFTVTSGGRLKKPIVLRPMTTTFETICFCQHPRSWDNIIICDVCHSEMHQRCCLIGPEIRGQGIAEVLKEFVCFSCRKSGQYSIGFSLIEPPDQEAIQSVSSAIENVNSVNLATIYGLIVNYRRPVPSKIADYRMMETIYQRYDLNAVCERKGPIYVAMKNYYSNNQRDMYNKKDFSELNLGHLIYMALQLICRIEAIQLPPIHTEELEFSCGEDLAAIVKANKKWITKLEDHCCLLGGKMQKLRRVPKASQDARDYESLLIRQLHELEDSCDVLQQALIQAEEHKASEKDKLWKEEALEKLSMIKLQTSIINHDLDNFLRQDN